MSQTKIILDYTSFKITDPISGKVLRNIFRPMAMVQMGDKNRETKPFLALLDSGSDRNLFPAAYGVSAGIDLAKGRHGGVLGIGGHKIKIYTHTVKLTLIATGNQSFTTEVDFSYQHNLAILGRNGFFNLFQAVNFKEKDKLVELTL